MTSTTRTIFDENWLSWRAGVGTDAVNREDLGMASQWESATLAQLFAFLLDRQREGQPTSADVIDFFVFCRRYMHKSVSQIYQDLWVLFMTGERRGGYFVEFGACDGVQMSNTLLLERGYGWSGILSEPSSLWHDALRRNRSAAIDTDCVAHATGNVVDFTVYTEFPELSHMAACLPDDIHMTNGNRSNGHPEKVLTVSLNDLLARHDCPAVVDYLSIDTEGSELEILQAFDFNRYDIRLMTVEHGGDDTKRAALRSLLRDAGFKVWCPEYARWDDWFYKPAEV